MAAAVMLFWGSLLAAGTAPKAAKTNVILITVDTVRADHLGCYGYKNISTPTIDSLATEGTLYERAISQVPLTWPSHTAILTGTYPFQNGVQDFTGAPLAPKFRTVAQAFQQHGYATGAVVSAFVLDRSWGLGRGFDFYDDTFSSETFEAKDIGLVDRRAAESVDHTLAWLKKNQARPFFFWLHLYDPHSPYDPPEPYRSLYRGHPYDGEIAYADHELGRLTAWLKSAGLYSRTALVLASDHGESLGDHGEKEHGFFIYNSTVHVPLIVKPAGASGKRKMVKGPVETIAIAPTLLQLAGVRDVIQSQFQVKPLPLDDADTPGAYSETFYPFSSFGWSPLHAVETDQYHYIESPSPELYDLSTDAGEEHDLLPGRAAVASVLKQSVEQRLALHTESTTGGQAAISPDAANKLRALGYFSYRSPVSADALKSGLADPKQKLWEFNAILEAADAFQLKDYAKGSELLRQVSEKDPALYIVPFMAGEAAIKRQDWNEAALQLRRCLELNADFDQAMTGLARALTKQGHSDEAKMWLEKALKYNPDNYRAWYELGVIQSNAEPHAALSSYTRAAAIQPRFPPLERDLGILQYRLGEYEQAARHLAAAVQMGIKEAPIYNFLGICYSRTGRLNDAVANYKSALAVDDDLAEAHLNLAYAYQRLHKPSLAAKEYATACRLESGYCRYVPAATP
ncbi:MAG: sulfatase-like hydrolase/transferase [Acidobacteriales bacterium]|nr:sulfatase-like hydrolase/transferase [Terriglobales bacterium]